MNRVDNIRERLTRQFTPDLLDIRDDSGLHAGHAGAAAGGGHFSVTIVTDSFAGKSMLERHRMVYASVADMMPAEIHALSIQALTVEEQESRV